MTIAQTEGQSASEKPDPCLAQVQTTKTTIERLARAVCGATICDPHTIDPEDLPGLIDQWWPDSIPAVRAVLQGLREPDAEMMEAMVAVGNHCAELRKFVAHGCVAPIFTAAIDAALQEKTA